MYKKILVPLDGSRFSEPSLEDIKAMAAPEVVLLMVLEPDCSFSTGELAGASTQLADQLVFKTEQASKAKAKAYIEVIAEKLRKAGVAVTSDIIFGRPAEEIVSYAEKNQFDLIVISTPRRSGGSRRAFGSEAEEVIRRSAVSVLISSQLGRKAKQAISVPVCAN
jgi:nucleotide-binding universal stress UspA family protein